MENALLLAALATLASKILELVKRLRAKDVNGVVTILGIWASGIIVTIIAAKAAVTETLVIPGTNYAFGALDGWSQGLLGLTLGSFIAITYDFRKALDNTDSAAQPKLLPPSAQKPPEA